MMCDRDNTFALSELPLLGVVVGIGVGVVDAFAP